MRLIHSFNYPVRLYLVALQSEIADRDKCRDSTITYNVTLRGGIDAGTSYCIFPPSEWLRLII